jgi:hypothetical protein
LKKYFTYLLLGLLLAPLALYAEDGKDSLSLSQPNHYKNYKGSIFLSKDYKGSASFVEGLSSNNSVAKTKKNWFKGMRYSGYARFYPMYRNLSQYYPVPADPATGLTVPVNISADDGYLQPLMLFRLEANPTAKSFFQMELQFSNLLNRKTTFTDTTGKLANLYVIFQLVGAVDTRIGHLKLTAGGGSNWARLSPSTLWGYQYRDDLFERYPWEPEGHDFSRYTSAYAVGDIPRDQRFGKQATQGFIFEGTNLPLGFDATLIYGKATSSGGFQTYLTGTPINIYAARIGKALGDHKLGFNYFNEAGYTSNQVIYKPIAKGTDTFYVADNYISQLVTTVDATFNFKKLSIYTELGGGSYLSNKYNAGLKDNAKPGVGNLSKYKRDWSENLFLEVTTKKELTGIPLKVGAYRIGANVVNLNSSMLNTSVEQAKPSLGTPDRYYTNYYDGVITDVGQLANNRQGLNISTNKKFNRLTVKLDMSIAQELKNLVGDIRNGGRGRAEGVTDSSALVPYTNSISYEHRLNGLTRSRFQMFERFTGPYQRIQSVYRRTYDNFAITDTLVDYKKSFNTTTLDLKYKFKFIGKELLLTSFSVYSSVQDHWSPIPVFTDDAFIRYFYQEFMAFYAIHPKVTLVGFYGIERVRGNSRLEVADANGNTIKDANGRPIADPNGKTVDQRGYGYGAGIDYNFHARASLNIRNRWYSHVDKSFTRDQFKGTEVTMEFKVFF